MSEPLRCASCGRPLGQPGPGGLCPVCLLKMGMEAVGDGAQLAARRPFLTGEESVSYAEAARTLEKAEGAVRVSDHRLRETLADTLSDPADVDAELAYLLDVLSRRHRTSSLEKP